MNRIYCLSPCMQQVLKCLPNSSPSTIPIDVQQIIWKPDYRTNQTRIGTCSFTTGAAFWSLVFAEKMFPSVQKDIQNILGQTISFPWYYWIQIAMTASSAALLVWQTYNHARAPDYAKLKTAEALCTEILDISQNSITETDEAASWLSDNKEIVRIILAAKLARKLSSTPPLSPQILSIILNKRDPSGQNEEGITIRDLLTPDFYELSHQSLPTFYNLCKVFPEYLQWQPLKENINKLSPSSLEFIFNKLRREHEEEDIFHNQIEELFTYITRIEILKRALGCLNKEGRTAVLQSIVDKCSQGDSQKAIVARVCGNNSEFPNLALYFSYFFAAGAVVPLEEVHAITDLPLQINHNGK